jgi:hemerythrin-like domain-containing protein
MNAEPVPESKEETAPGKDPVLNLRRDHTLLEMLAEGFRRLASSLEQGAAVDAKRISEGLEIHRLFLVETHHKKEQALDRELGRLPDRPFEKAVAACEREHAAAQRAAKGFESDLAKLEQGDAAARARLRTALVAEADRFMRHARQEEEEIYAKLQGRLPEAVAESVGHEIQKLRASSSAIEERLTSWTSRWGPASD